MNDGLIVLIFILLCIGTLFIIIWACKTLYKEIKKYITQYRDSAETEKVYSQIFNYVDQVFADPIKHIRSLGYNIDKQIKFAINSYFCIDDKNKKFYFITFKLGLIKADIRKYPIAEISELYDEDKIMSIAKQYIQVLNFDFKDLIKYDVVDKTKVDKERTFVKESNIGNVVSGALIGNAMQDSMLFGHIENAALVGAMAGSAGEQKIHEKVKVTTTVKYDIVFSLNNLQNSSITLTVDTDNRLREIVGIAEYILKNKS